jgi:TetR/AcrR family transcriptional regulator
MPAVSAPSPARAGAGRPRLSAADQAAKRESIVAAARHVFAQSGLSDTSMRAIAQQAGIAAGTIYRYFTDADALYAAVLARSLEELRAHSTALILPTSESLACIDVTAHAQAIYQFYLVRPDDAALGLYLHRGLRRSGLGHETDAQLNAALQLALQPLRLALRRHFKLGEAEANRELFVWMAAILGLVIFHHTGRAKSLGIDTDAAFAHLVSRLAAAPSA